MTSIRTVIPPQSAKAVIVNKGQRFRIVNTEGGQVVDTWMFNSADPHIYLSMAHSRTAIYRLFFQPGDTLVDNEFKPIVRFLSDTSAGTHDTLHAACSPGSNAFFGRSTDHPNCRDNLISVLRDRNIQRPSIPDPWNLFEETAVDSNGNLSDRPAHSKEGDYVELRAEQDLLLVCSACPSTVGEISGSSTRGAAIDLFP